MIYGIHLEIIDLDQYQKFFIMSTTLKIVLLGESGVGKTCIIRQFIDDLFEPNFPASISAQFMSKILEFEALNHKIN